MVSLQGKGEEKKARQWVSRVHLQENKIDEKISTAATTAAISPRVFRFLITLVLLFQVPAAPSHD
jgi:hypothetical protein